MLKIDGFEFVPIPGQVYKTNYLAISEQIKAGILPFRDTYRQVILNDLWFIVYFIYKNPLANHPFVIQACMDAERGPISHTLEYWAREHFKTCIFSRAEALQSALRDAEERIAILSHTRPCAKDILRSTKLVLEQGEMLKECFPDRLYKNPETESPKWSEDDGLIFKRKGYYRESTLEAHGLLEGMPQGKHFTRIYYVDIETDDIADNPETIIKLRRKFNLSKSLGTEGCVERVEGTYYTHDGILTYIESLLDGEGKKKYFKRVKPATDDGSEFGKPVLLSDKRWNDLKTGDPYILNCQYLLNPTPIESRKLDSLLIKIVEFEKIPKNLWKFLIVDPAGDKNKMRKAGDAWALGLIGIEPKSDEWGACNRYILDLIIEPMSEPQAFDAIARMYLKFGLVMKVGVENWGRTGIETHVSNILAKHGRPISEATGTLQILKPAGRHKSRRIADALITPLINSKWHISSYVDKKYADRLRMEMDKFPYWHDDGIDMLSYLDDMIKDYRFAGDTKLPLVEYTEQPII